MNIDWFAFLQSSNFPKTMWDNSTDIWDCCSIHFETHFENSFDDFKNKTVFANGAQSYLEVKEGNCKFIGLNVSLVIWAPILKVQAKYHFCNDFPP